MSYIRRSQLARYGRLAEAQTSLRKSASTRATVFLSHSHEDRPLVEQAIGLLGSQGVVVYVDWNDPTMPKATSADTAGKIKQRIVQAGTMIVLASTAGRNSKWVPWELGYADGAIGTRRIGILPVADDDGSFTGNEYLGLYKELHLTTANGWAFFSSGQTTGGTSLQDWLLGA